MSKVLNIQGEIKGGKTIMFCYAGLSLGDFLSGVLSQLLPKSRKKTIYIFIGLAAVFYHYLLECQRNFLPIISICFV
ncbi:MAG: hypothetical protein U5M51_06320 [Emticicia sp.]|nr:hypothetical protein [Emticicia sp.]